MRKPHQKTAAGKKMSPAAVARHASVHSTSHNPEEYNLPGSRRKNGDIICP